MKQTDTRQRKKDDKEQRRETYREIRKKARFDARANRREMRRPLSSSRSRNVISSPQATRVAFVSPFRIPSSRAGGTQGRGLNCNENPLILLWPAVAAAPVLFASYCQRWERRVNKILLCALSSSVVSALPLHRRLLVVRFSRVIALSRAACFLAKACGRANCSQFPLPTPSDPSDRRIHPFRWSHELYFTILIVIRIVYERDRMRDKIRKGITKGMRRRQHLYLTIYILLFYHYMLL